MGEIKLVDSAKFDTDLYDDAMPRIVLSDLHLCDGSGADDSLPATRALLDIFAWADRGGSFGADHGYRAAYQKILLGDIVEGWQVSGMGGLANIFLVNKEILHWLLDQSFECWVTGNHDHLMDSDLAMTLLERILGREIPHLTRIQTGIGKIYLEHGHQVDLFNSGKWRWIGKGLTGIYGFFERMFGAKSKAAKKEAFDRVMAVQKDMRGMSMAEAIKARRTHPAIYHERVRQLAGLHKDMKVYIHGHTHLAGRDTTLDGIEIFDTGCLVEESNEYHFVEIQPREVNLLKWSG